jgi:cobaltochelatase CobN
MIYFNYPHGSETIGAAYLNVLPESLWQIVQRLKQEGYRTGEALPASEASCKARSRSGATIPASPRATTWRA